MMVIAYALYIACLLALIGISYGIGRATGKRRGMSVNLPLIERDACERCMYAVRNRDLTVLHLNYCDKCSISEIKKTGGVTRWE